MRIRSVLSFLGFEHRIEYRQQDERNQCGRNQPSDNDDGKGPSGFGADPGGNCGGQEPQSSHEPGHYDWPEPRHRSFNDGILKWFTEAPQFANPFYQQNTTLNRYAEKSNEADHS